MAGIDFEKMTSVELATTIQNYQVKYTDKEGRQVVAWVERTYIENEPASDDFEVTYVTIDDTEEKLSPEDANEMIAFVKHSIGDEPVVVELTE
jgi:hypothetical protein